MNRKAKGTNAERELVSKFWKAEWAAIRVAGSGSSRFPSPDILAGNGHRKLAIECKTVAELKKYLEAGAVEELKSFSYKFGAEPWIGVRFPAALVDEQWHFVSLEDLAKTEKGFVISIRLARRKGLTFEQLIGKFDGQQNI